MDEGGLLGRFGVRGAEGSEGEELAPEERLAPRREAQPTLGGGERGGGLSKAPLGAGAMVIGAGRLAR